MARRTAEERFEEKYVVDEATGCWVWIGAKDKRGYGLFWDQGRTHHVYRWAYQRFVGDVPKGRHLDHFVCDNPPCVNPAHLRPTTPRENILRGKGPCAAHAAADACVNGHPFDIVRVDAKGRTRRRCSRCDGEYRARYVNRRRALT